VQLRHFSQEIVTLNKQSNKGVESPQAQLDKDLSKVRYDTQLYQPHRRCTFSLLKQNETDNAGFLVQLRIYTNMVQEPT
jgi:hypothetical protein